MSKTSEGREQDLDNGLSKDSFEFSSYNTEDIQNFQFKDEDNFQHDIRDVFDDTREEYQTNATSMSTYPGTNIAVVQNGSDVVVEGSDESLLQCVKSLLAGNTGQSIMILTKDGIHKEIKLESEIPSLDLKFKPPVSPQMNMLPSSSQFPDSSVSSSVNTSTTTKSSSHVSTLPTTFFSSATATDENALKELNFLKPLSPKRSDISNSTGNVKSESHLSQTSTSSLSSQQIIKLKNHRTEVFSHKNLKTNQRLSIHFQKKTESNKLSTEKQIVPMTKNLLTLAKQMIEGKEFNRPLSSDFNKETSTLNDREVFPDSSLNPDSDSNITMNLSSPDELKDKLEKLKTNSPVIVLQSGELLSHTSAEDGTSDIKLRPSCQVKNKISNSENPETKHVYISQDAPKTVVPSLPSNTVDYRCVECGYSSHNKHYYKQHVDLVHNTERPYKCPYCDYAGKRRHALLEHMVVHSNQRPFSCEHCNASFRKKGHLTNHIKLHTSQVKGQSTSLVHCGVCNIQLPDSEAFQAHLRKIHNTDKLYKCQLCEHTTVGRDAMLTHLAIHNRPVTQNQPVIQLPTNPRTAGIVYSCPRCPETLSSEESLVSHMKSSHGFVIVKNVSLSVKQALMSDINARNVSVDANTQHQDSQPANIMCSECGFVCSKPAAMKKHMWVHIKKDTDLISKTNNSQSQTQFQEDFECKSESEAALGILKMNVNTGQKTLPSNITYQCSSCCFTSSDNSVFIKHMLAHKTQLKQQNIAMMKTQGGQEGGRTMVYSEKPLNEVKYSSDANVPFVFDKAAGRYRCIICGYHCEFQRTIKAHIWKHSGHQNIQYPVFEVPSSKAPPQGSKVFMNSQASNGARVFEVSNLHRPGIHARIQKPENEIIAVNKGISTFDRNKSQESLQVFMARPLPSYKTSEMIASTSTVTLLPSQDKPVFTPEKNDTNDTENQEKDTSCQIQQNYLKRENEIDNEGCTEPGVVVEIVDSVPSSFGLTGMKSQQGSPRVLDLDGSGSEASLLKGFQAYTHSKKYGYDDKCVNTELVNVKSMQTSSKEVVNEQHSKLRCPSCDCVLTGKESLHSHFMVCKGGQPKSSESSKTTEKQRHMSKNESDLEENGGTPEEDTDDATESSDEQTVPNDETMAGGQQKTGICSSLLAVIEQLRERSQSESDDTKGQKGARRRGRNSRDSSPLTIEDLQNIDKIVENGCDKYRCTLCHYASARICNMRLHMKTHRQKKSTECSLCDFSSSSPEALQEHMLQHCKVRTYACKFCPQSFNHKSTLRAHLRAHKDHEPFLCAYCVFETTNPMEYREHMLVHSGCSSRLRCPLCENSFYTKDELTSHLLQCKGTGQKSGDETNRYDEVPLTSEERLGQDGSSSLPPGQHGCVVSGCAFSSSSLKELQEHLSIHCDPSLLMCNLCDFKALHSRSLKSHMKRHANDQRYVQQPLEQYKCNLCGYVCHHLPSLKSHMWRHASDQSYSYEFTNNVINAAIDHDTRVDADANEVDDPELLDRVINSERRILEGELNNSGGGAGQRPICWVTFRCCSCGFETINKAKLNIHMRSHSDLIQQALDIPRMSGNKYKSFSNALNLFEQGSEARLVEKRGLSEQNSSSPYIFVKVRKVEQN